MTPHFVMASGPQTIREATQTHAILLSALSHHDDVVLDCTEATEIDLSFLQLILAARGSAIEAGHRFTLRHRPQGLLNEALVRSGVLPGDDAEAALCSTSWARAEDGK